jgi:hypothetical protein
MKKQINIKETELGQKYFYIYEIKAVKHDGEVIVYDRELTKKAADKSVEFVERTMTRLYRSAFIREQIVWC